MNLVWRLLITILFVSVIGAGIGGARAHYAYPQLLEDYGITQEMVVTNLQMRVAERPDPPTILLIVLKVVTTTGGFFLLSGLLTLALSLTISILVLIPAHFTLHRLSLWPRLGLWIVWGFGLIALILESIHPLLNLKRVPEGPRTTLNFIFEAIGYPWVNGFVYLIVLTSIACFVGLAKWWPTGELTK